MSIRVSGESSIDNRNERRKTYLPRLSTTNDMISEEQSRNNDIFSPKPVNDTTARRTMYELSPHQTTEECTEEEVGEELEEDYDDCFSSDDTFGWTKEMLLQIGLSYVDSFSAIRNVLNEIPTPPLGSDTNLLLPAKAHDAPSHTLVLDLDETLVSCSLDKPPKYRHLL